MLIRHQILQTCGGRAARELVHFAQLGNQKRVDERSHDLIERTLLEFVRLLHRHHDNRTLRLCEILESFC